MASERGKSGIYAIRNIETGVCYVGQAVSIGDRWLSHKSCLRRGVHHALWLQASWNKRGEAAFVFEVLEYVPADVELLCAAEQKWIDALNSGYNQAPAAGSTLGLKHPPRSQEFRERMSRMNKGRVLGPESIALIKETFDRKKADGTIYRPSAEHKEKLRAIHRARVRTPEEIAKMRATLTGRKLSPEHCAAISSAKKGHVVSEETKRRIGAANKGKLTGRKQSDATKAKKSAAMKGRKRPDLSAIRMGRPVPEETRKKIQASNAAKWADSTMAIQMAIFAFQDKSNAWIANHLTVCRMRVGRVRNAMGAE